MNKYICAITVMTDIQNERNYGHFCCFHLKMFRMSTKGMVSPATLQRWQVFSN